MTAEASEREKELRLQTDRASQPGLKSDVHGILRTGGCPVSSEADGGANGDRGALRKVGAFCGSLDYCSQWVECAVLAEGITVRLMMVKS